MTINFILGSQGVIELHYFENGCHGLIIQVLALVCYVDLCGDLINAEQNLLDILQIAVVFPPESLEFFQEIVASFSGLTNHQGEAMTELVFSLGQS